MKSLMIVAASVAALTAGVAAPAMAQDTSDKAGVYGTIGYANVSGDGGGSDVNLGAIQGRLGYRFNNYFGVEGEAAFGVAGDEVAGVDVDLNHELGVFAVGFLPVSENVDLFARVGYASSEVEGSAGGTTISAEADGLAYGVGGQFNFTPNDGVRIDYTRHDGDDLEADVFGISYVRKF